MSDPSWRDVNPRRPATGRQTPPAGRPGSPGRGYPGRDGGPPPGRGYDGRGRPAGPGGNGRGEPAERGYPGRGGPGGRGYAGRDGYGGRNGYAGRDGYAGRGGPDWGSAPAGRPQRRGPDASSWRWGAMAGWMGVFIVVVATLIGIIGTLLAKKDPGTALGIVIIIGTIAAVFAVRPRTAYVIVPVPALAYVFGALVTGYVHDKASDTSHAVLVLNAAQWVAAGFTTMAAATLAALVIAVARWVLASRGGLRPAGPAGQAAAGLRAGRPGGPGSDQEPDPYSGYYDDGGTWR